MNDVMKRYILLFLSVICLAVSAQEQNGQKRQRMTPQDFQNKQKEFIIQHAELTDEESAAFFPLYFELQGKKHEANRRVWKQARAVKPHERTEEECDMMIVALADVKIECATLEKEYLEKFRKRRSTWKLSLPGMTKCPKCGEFILAHRVCKACGYYNGKEVVKINDEASK